MPYYTVTTNLLDAEIQRQNKKDGHVGVRRHETILIEINSNGNVHARSCPIKFYTAAQSFKCQEVDLRIDWRKYVGVRQN
jgi:hypothetical protein